MCANTLIYDIRWSPQKKKAMESQSIEITTLKNLFEFMNIRSVHLKILFHIWTNRSDRLQRADRFDCCYEKTTYKSAMQQLMPWKTIA